MLIRIKQIRPGGTEITLGKGKDVRTYHFKAADPEKPAEDHVCDITNADDMATLLAIKEGYEIHPSEVKARARTKADKAERKVVEKIQADALKQEKEAAAAAAPPPAPEPKSKYAGKDKKWLAAQVATRSGKKPHATVATAKLIAQLEELDAAGK